MDDEIVHRRVWPDWEFPLLCFGPSYPDLCRKYVMQELRPARVYIIVSKSLAAVGDHLQQLERAVGQERIAGMRIGMKPHTMYTEVIEIARDLERLDADCVVVMGGGSLIDGGKGAILALANKARSIDDLDDLFRKTMSDSLASSEHSFNGSSISMIAIPTTLSGGEYNAYGACTHDATRRKQLFGNKSQEPRLIILDAALTLTTPARVWISTGVRAIDHCIEAVCSINPNEKADADFLDSLQLLAGGLLQCAKNATDCKARKKCQLGCTSYMKVMLLKIPLGASHGIGRQLGPYNVPHGETSCILMPAVAKFNAAKRRAQQARILDVLWNENIVAKALETHGLSRGTADLGDVLDALIRELGMPRDLKSVGVGVESTEDIAESCLKDPWCRTNPVPLIDKAQVLTILEQVNGRD